MIVTFYSYKGGVGRSMALANVADILCRQGARVLMVDFDLEAPGLEQYFEVPQASARAHDGLIDLLAAFKEAMAVGGARQADFKDLDRFILPVYQKLPGGGSLHLMPAGKREGADLEGYATAVRSFDWQDFYFNWEGELFFEWLRNQLTSDRYDLVLVDSRTGVTEMGGICSYQLADQIVMFCAANKQNLRGTQNVADDFTSARVMARRSERPLGLVIVPARIEGRDPVLLDGFLRDFETTFQRYGSEQLHTAGLGASALMIPYQPELAFEERVITDPAHGADRKNIATAFLDLARAVTMLAPAGSRVADLCLHDGDETGATPLYDVASSFSGYDVHLAGSATIRDDLEQLKRGLEQAGIEVFLDAIEPVPPDEWKRRSEQILFHSTLLVIVGSDTTTAQQNGLRALLRANRGAKSRPVRLLNLRGARIGGLARVLELDAEAQSMPGGPDDPEVIKQLVALTRAAAAKRSATANASLSSPTVASSSAATTTPSASPPLAPPPAPVQAPEAAAPSVATSHPYRGGDPFREEEAGYYFGREQLVSDLVSALEAHPRVWLLGPSGSGKTSAVLAGAFPILRFRSTNRLLERVAVGPGCVAMIAAALERMPKGTERHVLFLDEFEQAFELPESERDALIATVTKLGSERPDVVVLIGASEDSIRSLRATPLGLAAGAPSTIRVGDFSTADLRAAIERPAERAGLAYEPGLVDRILSDAGRQASAIGLVQRTLSRLWEGRREGWLTNAAYERIGGIRAVVGEIADSALARNSADPAMLDRILLRLVAIDATAPPGLQAMEGKDDAHQPPRVPAPLLRRRLCVPVAELVPADGDPKHQRDLIRELVAAHLLVSRATTDEAPSVELIHDSAVTQGKLGERLADLVAKDREFLLWRQRLTDGIARREGLTGGALSTARGWLKTRANDLSVEERRAIRRATRRHRVSMAIWSTVFGVIVVLTVISKLRQDMVDRATMQVTAADELGSQRNWAAAVESLNVAQKRYPFRDSLLLKRGRAYARLGEDSLAVADFTAALAENSGLTDARIERASVLLEAGKYAEAMKDFDDIIRRDSMAAGAYIGRAVARDQLHGNPDSTLQDFTKALNADTTRIDVLFLRGRLNDRLGRTDAAVGDFRRILAQATNANDIEAARTQLNRLAPKDTTVVRQPVVRPTARAIMFLQYADPADLSTVRNLRTELTLTKWLNVPGPELIRSQDSVTVVELRYVADDYRLVKDVLDVTEAALAKVGQRIRIEPRVLDRKRFPNARPGRIELWLPPLSRSVYSVPLKGD